MLERRHSDRFEIPGAMVQYQMNGEIKTQMPLKDITNGGVRFGVSHDLHKGDYLELEIELPRNERISVKGNVVWATKADAAVQFLPFGTDEKYNSFESYQQIKNLMRNCINVVYAS